MQDLKQLTHVEVSKLWNVRHELFQHSEIDLKDNKRIDSAGIAFLVQWAKSNQNNQLTLLNASPTVKSLITTFHLEPLFILKN